MKSPITANRTGLAFTFAIIGFALIVVGIFRAFNGTGSGIEIFSAVGLFGMGAMIGNGFLSSGQVAALAVGCLILPQLLT